MRRPNFFIVGAPKCGTTAMNHYLGQHPEIFMCPKKETHHFVVDLPGHLDPRFETRSDYLGLFADARHESVVGEASVFYLYSRSAARLIREFEPKAKILAMFRNPVDWVASYHSQLLYNADENINSLEEALHAQNDRGLGLRLPPRLKTPHVLLYDDVCRFAEQLVRYLEAFGGDHVEVVLFDDLRDSPALTYRRVLEFLEVHPEFCPRMDVVNPRKEFLSTSFGRLVSKPPEYLRRAVRSVLPWSVASRIRDLLLRLNRRTKPLAPIDAGMRRALVNRYREQVESLANLIERDLSVWLDVT